MPIPAQYQEMLDQLTAQLPLWVDGAFAVMAVWGVLLWLNGRRLVKGSFTLLGLFGGAVAGAGVSQLIEPQASILLGVIVGAVAGVGVAWLAFRFWMAVVLGSLAFLLAPWCVAAWQGTEAVDPTQPFEDVSRQILREQVTEAREALTEDLLEGPTSALDAEPQAEDGAQEQNGPGVREVLADVGARYREAWSAWWAELSGTAKWSLLGVGALAAAGAFALGLIFPNTAAALVSALAGSILVLTALGRLGARHLPSAYEYLPQTPRDMLVAVGVATALGALIQWIFSRKRADT